MSHNSLKDTIVSPFSGTSSDVVNKKSHENEQKAENFISFIFKSVKAKLENEKQQKKKLVSQFVSSIFEEAKNQVIVSNFIDSMIMIAKNEINHMKNKNNNIHLKHDIQEKKIFLAPSDNIYINVNNYISTKTKGKANKSTCVKFDENNSPVKDKIILYTENKLISNSIVSTFNKEDKSRKKIFSNSSMEKTRNYSTCKKERKINQKLNSHKSKLSMKFLSKIESDKEKKQYEDKINLMKKHILVMRRRKEEMDKKISFLKHKEDNINLIKKEKAKLKKALKNNTDKKRNELAKKHQNIEKKKEEITKGLKQSFGKVKLEKIKQYKQIKEEKREINEQMRMNMEKNNSNLKRLIQKIRVLRDFNRNSVPKKKKELNKNNNYIDMKEYEKNKEITNFLKKQIMLLKDEENEYANKLNKTKAKLHNFDSGEKIQITAMKSYKKGKTQVINF